MEIEYGRRILECPLENVTYEKLPAMLEQGKYVKCCRCGSVLLKDTVRLPNNRYYCSHCLSLGRIVSNTPLFHIPEIKRQKQINPCVWVGQLTKAQAKVSQKVVSAIDLKQNLLVYAVTGAGKTEMLYEGITKSLTMGKRFCLATPRIDVCLELYPRITRDFPQVKTALLYGKNEAEYHDAQLVICTTHQLLRFYRAFDVLVVDEVDAFPFVNEEFLHFGAKNALKEVASLILLTATPSKKLWQLIKTKKLAMAVLPARFHKHILVEPTFKWCNNCYQLVNQGKMPRKLLSIIKKQVATNLPFLIFCPTISWLEKLAKILQKFFAKAKFTSVSSVDEKRQEKVQLMRERKYDFLLTTNILERGVTLPDISVIVACSNHHVFTKSALVQISGRVGRSKDNPTGKVYFLHDGISRAMKKARLEIKSLNNLAKKKGLVE